ncbi:MAG: FAD-binding oxidoreductase [Bellilinea sp.]
MHEIHSILPSEINFNQIKSVDGFDVITRDFPDYLTDESRFAAYPFDPLYFPNNEAELSAILREMNRQKKPVTVAAARTGLVGGSVPTTGAVISLVKFDEIEAVYFCQDAEEWRIRAQPAVNLHVLNDLIKTRRSPALENHANPVVKQDLYNFKQDPDKYFYPPDPTEMSASIGGTVATNASGARAYRYGPTRAWVRGIRVFLADGEYLDIPRGKYFASPGGQFTIFNSRGEGVTFNIPEYSLPKTKNAAGFYTAPQMDLIDLFIGSEGVLGVITRVEFALLKREQKGSMIQFLESEKQAVLLTQALRSDTRLRLDFIEFYSKNTLDLLREQQKNISHTIDLPEIPENARCALFFEMDFDMDTGDKDLSILEEVISGCGGDLTDSWVGFEDREMEHFKAFRHQVPESINRIIAERKRKHPGIHKLGTDLAVPDQHLAEMWELYSMQCEESGLEWYAFGHIGNNHIHVNIVPRDMTELHQGLELFESFAKKAVELGGTVSAEHGIGKIKHKFLQMMYSAEEIDQMRRVKTTLDPNWILNRGNIFPFEEGK